MAGNLLKLVLKVVNDPRNKYEVSKIEQSISGISKVAGGIVAGAGIGLLTSQMTSLFSESTRLAIEQRKQVSQLNAVIKSTGGAAGVSAKEVQELASSLQKVTNFGDEAILSGQNLLLTFTNIGKDVFPAATKTMLDMSAAMNQDLKTSAIQIGKALNAPIEGVSALTRVGVQFTDQQKELIATLVESGNTAEAQKIILQELNKEFGGSAEAAREADGGITALSNSVGDLKEALGELALVPLEPTANKLRELAEAITPKIQEGAAAWRGIFENAKYIKKVYDEAGVHMSAYSLVGLRTADTQKKLSEAAAKINKEMAAQEDAAQADAIMLQLVARESERAAVATAELAAAQRDAAQAAEAARYSGLASVYGAQTFQRDALERRRYLTNYFQSLKEIQDSTVDAIGGMGDNLKTVIDSVIRPTLSEVWQPKGAQDRMDEQARRLATVATQGFASEWLSVLNEQYKGFDFWQPITEAMQSGDDAALRNAAENILTGDNLSNLWDKDLIISRVKQQLQQQHMREEFAAAIAAELRGEGIDVSAADVSAQMGGVGQSAATIVSGINKSLPDAVSQSGIGVTLYKSLSESIKANKDSALQAAKTLVVSLNEYLPAVIGEFQLIDAITNNVGERFGLSVQARP